MVGLTRASTKWHSNGTEAQSLQLFSTGSTPCRSKDLVATSPEQRQVLYMEAVQVATHRCSKQDCRLSHRRLDEIQCPNRSALCVSQSIAPMVLLRPDSRSICASHASSRKAFSLFNALVRMSPGLEFANPGCPSIPEMPAMIR